MNKWDVAFQFFLFQLFPFMFLMSPIYIITIYISINYIGYRKGTYPENRNWNAEQLERSAVCSQLLFPYQAIECLADFVHNADGISIDVEPALQGNLLEVQPHMSVGEAVGHGDELPVEEA